MDLQVCIFSSLNNIKKKNENSLLIYIIGIEDFFEDRREINWENIYFNKKTIIYEFLNKSNITSWHTLILPFLDLMPANSNSKSPFDQYFEESFRFIWGFSSCLNYQTLLSECDYTIPINYTLFSKDLQLDMIRDRLKYFKELISFFLKAKECIDSKAKGNKFNKVISSQDVSKKKVSFPFDSAIKPSSSKNEYKNAKNSQSTSGGKKYANSSKNEQKSAIDLPSTSNGQRYSDKNTSLGRVIENNKERSHQILSLQSRMEIKNDWDILFIVNNKSFENTYLKFFPNARVIKIDFENISNELIISQIEKSFINEKPKLCFLLGDLKMLLKKLINEVYGTNCIIGLNCSKPCCKYVFAPNRIQNNFLNISSDIISLCEELKMRYGKKVELVVIPLLPTLFFEVGRKRLKKLRNDGNHNFCEYIEGFISMKVKELSQMNDAFEIFWYRMIEKAHNSESWFQYCSELITNSKGKCLRIYSLENVNNDKHLLDEWFELFKEIIACSSFKEEKSSYSDEVYFGKFF